MQINQSANIDLQTLLAGGPSVGKEVEGTEGLVAFAKLMEEGMLQNSSAEEVAEAIQNLDEKAAVELDQMTDGKITELLNSNVQNESEKINPLLKQIISKQGDLSKTETLDGKEATLKKLTEQASDEVVDKAAKADRLTALLKDIKKGQVRAQKSDHQLDNMIKEKVGQGDLSFITKEAHSEETVKSHKALQASLMSHDKNTQNVAKDTNGQLALLQMNNKNAVKSKALAGQYKKNIQSDDKIIKLTQKIANSKDTPSVDKSIEPTHLDHDNVFALQGDKMVKVAGVDNGVELKSEGTLDLSHIKAESKSDLIKEVSTYIEQSYVSGKGKVDLIVKHDELGQFRVIAEKSGPGNQVNLQIDVVEKEAKAFFVENESDLIKNLQNSGIKLSQVKITAKAENFFMSETKNNNFDQSSEQGRSGYREEGRDQRGQARQNFSDHQSEKRKELWEHAQEMREQYAA